MYTNTQTSFVSIMTKATKTTATTTLTFASALRCVIGNGTQCKTLKQYVTLRNAMQGSVTQAPRSFCKTYKQYKHERALA